MSILDSPFVGLPMAASPFARETNPIPMPATVQANSQSVLHFHIRTSFFYSKVKSGDALYVNTNILLGGYGGECDRNYVIAPATPHHEKIWQVVADTVQIMVEETMPWRVCSEVAFKVR